MSIPTPTTDLVALTNQLGQAWGVSFPEPLLQYVAWSETIGIFAALSKEKQANISSICQLTGLNSHGADALLSVLASIGLVSHIQGKFSLTALAIEYLTPASPFYAGFGLFQHCRKTIPQAYLERPSEADQVETNLRLQLDVQLRIQHSRNFPPSVVAARTGAFLGVRHLVDMAGGSGVIAIPLAMDHPQMRITLVELPKIIPKTREILQMYGVEKRITLVPMDILTEEWRFDGCDGAFFGNVFHGHDESDCRTLARKSAQLLRLGGRILLHEVLFNENRDGPTLAALWNANMVARKKGARQRSASELQMILRSEGFDSFEVRPTAGGFSLISGTRMRNGAAALF